MAKQTINATPDTHGDARTKINANWRIAIENGFDTGHLYLHRNWAAAETYDVTVPIGAVHGSTDEITVVDEPGCGCEVAPARVDILESGIDFREISNERRLVRFQQVWPGALEVLREYSGGGRQRDVVDLDCTGR